MGWGHLFPLVVLREKHLSVSVLKQPILFQSPTVPLPSLALVLPSEARRRSGLALLLGRLCLRPVACTVPPETPKSNPLSYLEEDVCGSLEILHTSFTRFRITNIFTHSATWLSYSLNGVF